MADPADKTARPWDEINDTTKESFGTFMQELGKNVKENQAKSDTTLWARRIAPSAIGGATTDDLKKMWSAFNGGAKEGEPGYFYPLDGPHIEDVYLELWRRQMRLQTMVSDTKTAAEEQRDAQQKISNLMTSEDRNVQFPDEPHDWHTIEIYFSNITERDQARDEIERLLAGRGMVKVHTWVGLPVDCAND